MVFFRYIPVGLALFLFWAGLSEGQEAGTLSSQLPGSPSPRQSETLTPDQRRAQIRDSLRRERAKLREESAPRSTNTMPPAVSPNSGEAPPASPAPQSALPPSESPPKVQEGPSVAASPPPPIELPLSDTLVIKSLNVRNTEIRDVLSGLGSQFGINILMASDVQGPVTVNFHKIKLRDALRLMAEENGYALEVSHGAIKVNKKAAALAPPPPKPRFDLVWDGKNLSVDIEKAPLDQVIRRILEVTGKNLVAEAGAQGEISAFFKNVEWAKALRLIADGANLLVRERDGIWSLYAPPWGMGQAAKNTDGTVAATASGNMRIAANKDLLSLEANMAPLANVVSALSAHTGISTVIYGEIKGAVTLKVVDVKLEPLFGILFRGSEYTFWTQKGIYFIGPHGLQGVNNSRLIVLKHMKVEEAMELLPATLTKDAQIKVVKSQNALMVLGSYEQIEGIGQYVQQIDRPVAQILIEALVVDVDMDRIRQYGVDMFLGDIRRVKSAETIYPAVQQVFNKQRSKDLLSGIPGLRDIVSLPRNFVAKVDALEQEKVLKIRSRPQISTLNGSEATITIGQTQYFLLKQETDFNQTGGVTSRTAERFEKIEANVTLTVTPFVTGEGEITCDIVPDFSEPEGSFDSQTPPTLNRRYLKSKVRLRDGETIVLGGLVKEGSNRTSRQFPLLGSIPIIGWLFKNNEMVHSRSQLLIFVTPHVYYGHDAHVNPNEYIKKSTDLDK